jgi:hypothetical protein
MPTAETLQIRGLRPDKQFINRETWRAGSSSAAALLLGQQQSRSHSKAWLDGRKGLVPHISPDGISKCEIMIF